MRLLPQHFSVCPEARTRTMSESGADRKKRLRAMRDDAEYVDAELKFRNYLPKDEVLLEGQVRGCSSRPTVRRRPTLSSSSRAENRLTCYPPKDKGETSSGDGCSNCKARK